MALFDFRYGSPEINLACRDISLANVSPAPDRIASRHGWGLRTDANGEGMQVALPARMQITTWPVTLLWFGDVLGTATSNPPLWGALYNDTAASPFTSYELGRSTASNQWRMGANTGGAFVSKVTSAAVVTGVQAIVAEFLPTTTSRIWRNGIEYTAFATNNSFGTGPGYGSAPLLVAGADDARNAATPNAVTYLAAAWSRELTVPEVVRLSVDPFLLLRERSPIARPPTAVAGSRRLREPVLLGGVFDLTGGLRQG